MAYGIQDTVGMLDIPGRIAAEQAAEAETMTNPVDQLGSFINYLMSMVGLGNGVPQQQVDGGAHDSIIELLMKIIRLIRLNYCKVSIIFLEVAILIWIHF